MVDDERFNTFKYSLNLNQFIVVHEEAFLDYDYDRLIRYAYDGILSCRPILLLPEWARSWPKIYCHRFRGQALRQSRPTLVVGSNRARSTLVVTTLALVVAMLPLVVARHHQRCRPFWLLFRQTDGGSSTLTV